MLEMYKGVANSPETTITNDINNLDTIIYVLDETRIPELPNLMVLGNGISAETVKVLSIAENALTVERGFQGVPKSWNAGTIIARNFTEYDYNALVENVKELDDDVGDIEDLETEDKTNIVNAVNEVKTQLNEMATEFNTHKNQKFANVGLITEPKNQTTKTTVNLGYKPKLLMLDSVVLASTCVSVGKKSDVLPGGDYCVYVTSESGSWSIGGPTIHLRQNNSHYILGTVIFTDVGFEITWALTGSITDGAENRRIVYSAISH